jgi:hypothetical protein
MRVVSGRVVHENRRMRASGLEPGSRALEETEAGLIVRRFTFSDAVQTAAATDVRYRVIVP